MVLSYDYSSQNRRRQQTNAPPSRAISMAMVVRWCGMKRIAQCSMTRASPEATGRRHRATNRSVSPRWPRRATINLTMMQHALTLLAVLMAIAMRRYYTARINQWRRFVAFIKGTKCHHRTSTRSDIIKGTSQIRLFRTFHHEKELQLTCWPLITIGVWHIKLTRSA